MGRTRSTSGRNIASRDTAAEEVETLVLGGLERAEHRLLAAARRRSSASCTTTPSTACAARCPPRASAARTPRAAPAASSSATSSSTACSGTNYATGKTGTPLDFISFHAKGAPTFVDGHVRMGIASQLRDIDDALRGRSPRIPSSRTSPSSSASPIPEGCAACQGPQLGYRNGTMYSSYTAASFARKHELADKHGVNLEGALTWAFEFEDQPYFAGFRVAGQQRHRPAGAQRLPHVQQNERPAPPGHERRRTCRSMRSCADGVRKKPDVSALASLDRQKTRRAGLALPRRRPPRPRRRGQR